MQEAYDACGGDVAGLIAQPYDHGNFYDNKCASKEQWQKFANSATITVWFSFSMM